MNSHDALPRAGLLGARGRSVSMGLMLVLAACGSSTSPADGGSGSVPLDPAERNAIVGDLQGASTVLAATSPASALAARVAIAKVLRQSARSQRQCDKVKQAQGPLQRDMQMQGSKMSRQKWILQ